MPKVVDRAERRAAIAAAAAAAIAEDKPLGIAVGAVKLAITAFIVPFAFMYGDGLLMEGSILNILVSCTSAVIGVILLSAAVEGYLKNNLDRLIRMALFIAGLLFIFPGIVNLILGSLFTLVAVLATPHLRKEVKGSLGF